MQTEPYLKEINRLVVLRERGVDIDAIPQEVLPHEPTNLKELCEPLCFGSQVRGQEN